MGVKSSEKMQMYTDLFNADPTSSVASLSASLVDLDALVDCENSCSPGGLSLDDIVLWSRLRGITMIKGITWPVKLRKYMDNLSVQCDVGLYDGMAL